MSHAAAAAAAAGDAADGWDDGESQLQLGSDVGSSVLSGADDGGAADRQARLERQAQIEYERGLGVEHDDDGYSDDDDGGHHHHGHGGDEHYDSDDDDDDMEEEMQRREYERAYTGHSRPSALGAMMARGDFIGAAGRAMTMMRRRRRTGSGSGSSIGSGIGEVCVRLVSEDSCVLRRLMNVVAVVRAAVSVPEIFSGGGHGGDGGEHGNRDAGDGAGESDRARVADGGGAGPARDRGSNGAPGCEALSRIQEGAGDAGAGARMAGETGYAADDREEAEERVGCQRRQRHVQSLQRGRSRGFVDRSMQVRQEADKGRLHPACVQDLLKKNPKWGGKCPGRVGLG